MRTTDLSQSGRSNADPPYGAVMLIEGLTGTIYHDFAGFSYHYTDSTTIILKPQFIHRRGRSTRRKWFSGGLDAHLSGEIDVSSNPRTFCVLCVLRGSTAFSRIIISRQLSAISQERLALARWPLIAEG